MKIVNVFRLKSFAIYDIIIAAWVNCVLVFVMHADIIKNQKAHDKSLSTFIHW